MDPRISVGAATWLHPSQRDAADPSFVESEVEVLAPLLDRPAVVVVGNRSCRQALPNGLARRLRVAGRPACGRKRFDRGFLNISAQPAVAHLTSPDSR